MSFPISDNFTVEQYIDYITSMTQVPLKENWTNINLSSYCRTKDSIILILQNPKNVEAERPAIIILNKELQIEKIINYAELIQSKFVPSELAYADYKQIKDFIVYESGKVQINLQTEKESLLQYRSLGTIFDDTRRFGKIVGKKNYFEQSSDFGENISNLINKTQLLSIKLPYYFEKGEYVLRETQSKSKSKYKEVDLWLSSGGITEKLFENIPLRKELYPFQYPNNGVYTSSGIYVSPNHSDMVQIEIIPSNNAELYSVFSPSSSLEIIEGPMKVRLSCKRGKGAEQEDCIEIDKILRPVILFSPTSNKALVFALKARTSDAIKNKLEEYLVQKQLLEIEDVEIKKEKFENKLKKEEIFVLDDWRKIRKSYGISKTDISHILDNEREWDLENFEFKSYLVDLESRTINSIGKNIEFIKTIRMTRKTISKWPITWFNKIEDTLFTWQINELDQTGPNIAYGAYNIVTEKFTPFIPLKSLRTPASEKIIITREDDWLLFTGINDNGQFYSLKEFNKKIGSLST